MLQRGQTRLILKASKCVTDTPVMQPENYQEYVCMCALYLYPVNFNNFSLVIGDIACFLAENYQEDGPTAASYADSESQGGDQFLFVCSKPNFSRAYVVNSATHITVP